ncbi:helix-turn-helix transcriptional regulator [Halalkalicoccus tibetensis]|uniref:Helix-turn-helix transcriptional regulator n=1 Tax=Halalkalicoccus tibetensis TaxID=175632 RepID=A0ABD5V5B8_9EURY
MSETQSTPDEEVRTVHDLTAFQQTILTVLSENPQYGLAIKSELEDYYESEVNHGRLYPNLNELVERNLIAKSELDKRTNQYELIDEGYDLLLGELNWKLSKIMTIEERADDITQLFDNAA